MSITKKEVLENIEQVKKYIEESEKESNTEKVVGIEIKSIFGNVIFRSKKTTLVEAILEANLSEANLREADLSEADLSGAELMSAKFYGKGGTKQLKKSQLPDFLLALGFVIVD